MKEEKKIILAILEETCGNMRKKAKMITYIKGICTLCFCRTIFIKEDYYNCQPSRFRRMTHDFPSSCLPDFPRDSPSFHRFLTLFSLILDFTNSVGINQFVIEEFQKNSIPNCDGLLSDSIRHIYLWPSFSKL
ncbi:hypothetical protein CDAR_445671 [Caerostris darwini]|uniref:Uncharacterized protein n=1 Tax=Caerostris darwini TaxID=1538125 RepID=A0AAV4U7G6_9ARAC|nr:hypothetical protein CDAR_445671 [Caerostris darwini]